MTIVDRKTARAPSILKLFDENFHVNFPSLRRRLPRPRSTSNINFSLSLSLSERISSAISAMTMPSLARRDPLTHIRQWAKKAAVYFYLTVPCREDAHTRYGYTRVHAQRFAHAPPPFLSPDVPLDPRPESSAREPRRVGHGIRPAVRERGRGLVRSSSVGTERRRWRGWRHHLTSPGVAGKRPDPRRSGQRGS